MDHKLESIKIIEKHDENNRKYRKLLSSIIIPRIGEPDPLDIEVERKKYNKIILEIEPKFEPTIMTQYAEHGGEISQKAFILLPVNYDDEEDPDIPEGERGIFISASMGSKSRGIERKEGSKSFKNSCMLRLKGRKNIRSDVKLFMKIIHICGCKNSEDSQETYLIILENLVKIQKIVDVINFDPQTTEYVTHMILSKVRGELMIEEKDKEYFYQRENYEDILYTVSSSTVGQNLVLEEKNNNHDRDEEIESEYSLNNITLEDINDSLESILRRRFVDIPESHYIAHMHIWGFVCKYILSFIKETAVFSEFKNFIEYLITTEKIFDDKFGNFVRHVPMVNHNFTPLFSICRRKLVEEVLKYPYFTVSHKNLVDSHVTIRISMKYVRKELKKYDELTKDELDEVNKFYEYRITKNRHNDSSCVIRMAPKPRATLLINSTKITQSNPDADSSAYVYRTFSTLLNILGDSICLKP